MSVSTEFPIDDGNDVWPHFTGDVRDPSVPFCRSATECEGDANFPAHAGGPAIATQFQVWILDDLDTAADWHETAVEDELLADREHLDEYDGDFDGRAADRADFYCAYYGPGGMFRPSSDPVSDGWCQWFVVLTYGQYAVSLFVMAYDADLYFDNFVSGYVRPVDEAMADLVS